LGLDPGGKFPDPFDVDPHGLLTAKSQHRMTARMRKVEVHVPVIGQAGLSGWRKLKGQVTRTLADRLTQDHAKSGARRHEMEGIFLLDETLHPQVLIGRELRHERGRIAFRHIKRPGEHAEILFSHRQSRTRALARHGATSAVGIGKDNMHWPAIKKHWN
jgi:hypothetical protein